jgi:hypothetical protein
MRKARQNYMQVIPECCALALPLFGVVDRVWTLIADNFDIVRTLAQFILLLLL